MHNRARTCISACFYYSGLVSLVRWWIQRSGHYLIILCYHRASGGNLRSHLLYLCRHFRILPLETALEELYMSHKKGVQVRDRRTLLALTFDDGYYDNYTHAFALACELQVPITIFLIPGYMESGNSFWWKDRLICLAQVDQVTVEGRIYHLSEQKERKALAQVIEARLHHAASIAEREEFLGSLCQRLGVASSVMPGEEPAPLLKWAQVREMEESGWVSFGAHTIHHPDLQYLVDPTEVQREVGECRMMLEQQLGHPVRAFAYPHGNIGDQGLCAVQQAGYNCAVTIVPGFNTRYSDSYLLRRRVVDVNQHWLLVAAETTGIWFFFSRLKRVTRLLMRKLLHLTSSVGK
jgi:peptidoglycan/xylan/chitin deacetylase (PgdA/CDA1 family)